MTAPVRVTIDVFEDRYPEGGTARGDVPDALLSWFRSATAGVDLAVLPELPDYGHGGGMAREIEILLCSRETMDTVFDSDGLGVHLVETPEGDPFGDDSPFARKMRCAVVIDLSEMSGFLSEEISKDGDFWPGHLEEYEEALAATAFHEIAHAVLFATNSQWLSPQDADVLIEAGDLEHDLFDLSSGYGMRALPDEAGHEAWADTVDEAHDLMEGWCERQGREWYREAAARAEVRFFDALGLDAEALARGVSGPAGISL